MEPRVSVIMSALNAEKYLVDALESILNQSVDFYEVIVIDNGSTDSTAAILASAAERHANLRVYRNDTTLPLPDSLNRAISLSRGEYLVRMDADDLSRFDRIELQTAFMDSHRELGLSCCRILLMTEEGYVATGLTNRLDADGVRALFLFFDPVAHPGVIIRKSALGEFRYTPGSCAEDLDLWLRLERNGVKIGVQEEYLLCYRVHPGQMTSTMKESQKKEYMKIIRDYYSSQLMPLSDGELAFLTEGIYSRTAPDPDRLTELFRSIRRANGERKYCSSQALTDAMLEIIMAYKAQLSLGTGKLLGLALRTSPPAEVLQSLIGRKTRKQESLPHVMKALEGFGISQDKIRI